MNGKKQQHLGHPVPTDDVARARLLKKLRRFPRNFLGTEPERALVHLLAAVELGRHFGRCASEIRRFEPMMSRLLRAMGADPGSAPVRPGRASSPSLKLRPYARFARDAYAALGVVAAARQALHGVDFPAWKRVIDSRDSSPKLRRLLKTSRSELQFMIAFAEVAYGGPLAPMDIECLVILLGYYTPSSADPDQVEHYEDPALAHTRANRWKGIRRDSTKPRAVLRRLVEDG